MFVFCAIPLSGAKCEFSKQEASQRWHSNFQGWLVTGADVRVLVTSELLMPPTTFLPPALFERPSFLKLSKCFHSNPWLPLLASS